MRTLLAAGLILSALVASSAQSSSQDSSRVVAVADVHGAYDEFVGVLRRAGVIDEKLAWSGRRTTLVQTGDTTDRGADVRKVLDLLMRLEREARPSGGQVVTLLGNHEVMNLIGDWRDVTPEICGAFITASSEQRRQQLWTEYERLKQRPRDAAIPAVYQLTREQWMQAHPPGCIEYREAMSASGTYGRWLRQKDIAVVLNSTLFMHAGINPARPPTSVREVIDRARDEIRRVDGFRQRAVSRKVALPTFTLQQLLDVGVSELQEAVRVLEKAKAEGAPPPALDAAFLREAQAFLEIGKWSLLDPEGPLWFRGYAQWDETATRPQVASLLDGLKLTRIVVGHTPTADRRVRARYEGRVILLDTGMLTRVYQGMPAALEFRGTSVKALYADTEEVIVK
jgi:hypothetical protein